MLEKQSTSLQECAIFCATNFELGAISPLLIHQLSRSRWRIDAEIFQTITINCHLKHPAVHQSTALVVLTMIRLLAYAPSLVFYRRQICSHARAVATLSVTSPNAWHTGSWLSDLTPVDQLIPVPSLALPPYSRKP